MCHHKEEGQTEEEAIRKIKVHALKAHGKEAHTEKIKTWEAVTLPEAFG